MQLYRVTPRPWAKAPLDGEGPFRYGARWSSAGVRVAYASGTAALAQVEYLGHMDFEDLPQNLVYSVAAVPDGVAVEVVADGELPADWRTKPASASTKAIGDAWAMANRAALLSVPSVHLPLEIEEERNFLINPLHPDFRRIRLGNAVPFAYDARLVRRR